VKTKNNRGGTLCEGIRQAMALIEERMTLTEESMGHDALAEGVGIEN